MGFDCVAMYPEGMITVVAMIAFIAGAATALTLHNMGAN